MARQQVVESPYNRFKSLIMNDITHHIEVSRVTCASPHIDIKDKSTSTETPIRISPSSIQLIYTHTVTRTHHTSPHITVSIDTVDSPFDHKSTTAIQPRHNGNIRQPYNANRHGNVQASHEAALVPVDILTYPGTAHYNKEFLPSEKAFFVLFCIIVWSFDQMKDVLPEDACLILEDKL